VEEYVDAELCEAVMLSFAAENETEAQIRGWPLQLETILLRISRSAGIN
jgi:hypothetical protein